MAPFFLLPLPKSPKQINLIKKQIIILHDWHIILEEIFLLVFSFLDKTISHKNGFSNIRSKLKNICLQKKKKLIFLKVIQEQVKLCQCSFSRFVTFAL